jgi:hypothetical protein
MNKKYLLLCKALKETVNSTAAINSYESLPTRNSPKTLVTSVTEMPDEKLEKDEYPFMTLRRLRNTLAIDQKGQK